uniref:Glyco_hydro2_C5 domain-containing protein n=1 Tax=Strongyloides stercoralis TaxID=6248 RepID=A0A0K0EP84_STRER
MLHQYMLDVIEIEERNILKPIKLTSYYWITTITKRASLFFDSVAVGETFNYDFGKNAKSLRITRDEGEEILHAGQKSKHSNVELSKDGILKISPVTENDFATYAVIMNKETKVDGAVIAVGPPTLNLKKKE